MAEESCGLATDNGLTALAQQIKPVLDSVGSKAGQPPIGDTVREVIISTPHRAVDPNRAARLNIQMKGQFG